jgi:hypothetical protein
MSMDMLELRWPFAIQLTNIAQEANIVPMEQLRRCGGYGLDLLTNRQKRLGAILIISPLIKK